MKCTEIETYLLTGLPEKYLPIHFTCIDDLFDNYLIISSIHYDPTNRDRLLKSLCEYILSRNKNKKAIACKIIYKIIKCSSGKVSDPGLIELLFKVYSKYIQKKTNDSWKFSSFIKDLPLSESQIAWLIENCTHNEYILNRILRYPYKSHQIKTWAEECIIKNNIVDGRFSEILGLALDESNFQIYYSDSKIKTQNLAWAIYYSKLLEKEQYILQLLQRDKNCIHIAKVASRLNYYEIVEKQNEIFMEEALTISST